MLRTLTLSTAALVLSTVALAVPASAEPVPAPTMTVVGDSITSWFRDEPGSVSQGWWSMLARDLDASVNTLAEGGSGMNVRGNGCFGTTFGQRLAGLQKVDYVIIEGGRNDMFGCTSLNTKRTLTRAQQKHGIRAYLHRLGARVDFLGIPRSHVLIVSPWGTSDRKRGYVIQAYQRLYANRNHEGFTYVETRTLPSRLTFDTKHPNREGNTYLSAIMNRAVRSVS